MTHSNASMSVLADADLEIVSGGCEYDSCMTVTWPGDVIPFWWFGSEPGIEPHNFTG